MKTSSKLKELRTEKNISQIEMALTFNMSLSNYCNYEARRYVSMPKELKRKIEEYFQTEYEYEGRWY